MITNLSEDLTPIQIFALSKAVESVAAKAARAAIGPGEHEVPRFFVGIGGSLKVSEDETYRPTTSVSLIGAVCVAIRRMGIQREAFLKCMKEVCQEALTKDEPTRAALMLEANVKEFEAAFKSQFTSQLPTKTRKGKVNSAVLACALPAVTAESNLELHVDDTLDGVDLSRVDDEETIPDGAPIDDVPSNSPF